MAELRSASRTPSLTLSDLSAPTIERPKFSAEHESRSLSVVEDNGSPGVQSQDVVVVRVEGSGDPGGSQYSHHQVTPAATWTIEHNLGTRPQFLLFIDSDPDEPVITDTLYPTFNTAVIEWPQPESGWAFY